MPATYTVSIAQLRAWDACKLDARVADLRTHLGRDVAEDEDVPLITWADVTPVPADHVWALAHIDRVRAVALCADIAEAAVRLAWLPIYPGRPMDAVRAARSGPGAAVNAAVYAAYAAAAVYAADDDAGAYAAVAATGAADDAAYTAANAAYAAASAAYAAAHAAAATGAAGAAYASAAVRAATDAGVDVRPTVLAAIAGPTVLAGVRRKTLDGAPAAP